MRAWISMVIALTIPLPSARSQEQQGVAGGSSSRQVYQCSPGPWGELEYYYTYLEAPPHVMELVNTPSESSVWFLPGKTFEQLEVFLLECGIGEEVLRRIFENSSIPEKGPPFILFPEVDDVESLSFESRTKLYAELRRYPENRFPRSPVIVDSGNLRDWFEGSNLKEETMETMERLTYRIGDSLAFSDIPVVLSKIKDDPEEREFLRALTRTRSLILRLRVDAESDYEALKNYWTAGFRSRDIVPLLESIAYREGVEYFDVSHLLPPTARKFLYTFPTPSLGVEGIYPDSFWISLNFFSYLPNNDLVDNHVAMATLAANYEEVRGDFRFGDVLVFRDSISGVALHSCVFVADDIVYTKNGRSILRPFVFMKIEDLTALYSAEKPAGIEVWRAVR